MTTPPQVRPPANTDHAPLWVSIVSGLAGQAPIDRREAVKRFILLLGFLIALGVVITGSLVVRALTEAPTGGAR